MNVAFSISDSPLDGVAARARILHRSAGALVVFEGWVRDHRRGLPVTALRYEAYAPLAEREGNRVLAEAAEKFDLRAAHCIHRVGNLEIGETAVWVGAVADHRDAAFDACRFIIDEIKSRVPIWKQEFHSGMVPVWVDPRPEKFSSG